MRGAGISGAGISADLDGAEDLALDGEEPEIGAEASPPETVTGGDGARRSRQQLTKRYKYYYDIKRTFLLRQRND